MMWATLSSDWESVRLHIAIFLVKSPIPLPIKRMHSPSLRLGCDHSGLIVPCFHMNLIASKAFGLSGRIKPGQWLLVPKSLGLYA